MFGPHEAAARSAPERPTAVERARAQRSHLRRRWNVVFRGLPAGCNRIRALPQMPLLHIHITLERFSCLIRRSLNHMIDEL